MGVDIVDAEQPGRMVTVESQPESLAETLLQDTGILLIQCIDDAQYIVSIR
jgi:hypothetical protein